METTEEPEVSKIILHPDLVIPAAGEEVAATRYKPVDITGPLPTVMVATPYRKDDRITFGSWDPSIRYLASHGYEIVVVDLIGTGASTGTKEPFTRREGEQLAEVINWITDQSWTTDKVGMFGLSYGAWTQYATAAIAPDALKAIIPVSVSPSVYQSSCTGGVFNPLKRATWTAQMQTSLALPPSRRDADGRWKRVWQSRLDELRDKTPWLFEFLGHERNDSFWDERIVVPNKISVPTLAACGYRDVHTGPMVEFFRDLDAPKRLVLGPWRHTMPERGRESAVDFRRQAVEWFDRFLKGKDNDALEYPTVAYWTEREGGWQIGAGSWRGTEIWPDVSATDPTTLSFALTADGLEPAEAARGNLERDYEYDHTVGIDSIDRVGNITNTGVDTNADDARSLTFEFGPLDSAIELTGTGAATLRVRASTPKPLIALRIIDIAPDGTARTVTSGYLRASHHTGHADPQPLTEGREVELTIPLKPKSHIFERNHRIRVAISAANFPRALPPNEQGTLTVLSRPDASSIIQFPGAVHEEITFPDSVSMEAPDESLPLRTAFVEDEDSAWTTSREHVGDSAWFSTTEQYSLDLPHANEMTWQSDVEAGVEADNPGTAYLRTKVEATLKYPTERVRVITDARVSRAIALLSTNVQVDGQVIFDEHWRQ